MGIVYNKSNGLVGIEKEGVLLFGKKYKFPVEIIDSMPDGEIVFKYNNEFIVYTEDKIYLSGYKECDYRRVVSGKTYKDIKICDMDGNIKYVYPSALAMTYRDKRLRKSLISIIKNNADRGSVFMYKGEPSIMLMEYGYSDIVDYINRDTMFHNGRATQYVYKYDIIGKDGKHYTGIKPTIKSIAEETGYTQPWISMVANSKGHSDKIKIEEIPNW